MNKEFEQKTENYEINFGKFFRLILMQSKLLIVVFLVIIFALAALFISSNRTYQIKSLLQVYSSSAADIGSSVPSSLLMGSSNTSSIDNLIAIYDSRSNVIKLIDTLNLNLKTKNIKDEKFLRSGTFEPKYLTDLTEKYSIKFKKDIYELYDDDENLLFKASYNEKFENSSYIASFPTPGQLLDSEINFSYSSAENLANQYQRKIKVASLSTRSIFFQDGIIQITFESSNPEEAIKIINLANEIFISQNIEVEKERAQKAVEFIDANISSVEEILNNDTSRLKNFQEENSSLNVDLEIESIIESISVLEGQISNFDLEIAKIENTYTKQNPLFRNLVVQRDELIKQKIEIESRIKKLPLAQQEYIDLYRKVQISQELYSELLNRRLSFSIMEASTIGNIGIVDPAYKDIQTAPQIAFYAISALMLFALAILIALFRGLFFIPISNPAELNDNGITIPIAGVIPFAEDEDSEDNEMLNQSMESLVVNINKFLGNEQNAVMFTSPTSKCGKSFVSRNIAKRYQALGKKVLLIDSDLKRGKQHITFKTRTMKLDDFFNISASSIEKFKIEENLYVLPRISGLKSSFEVLNNPRYDQTMERLKQLFDLVIIDCPPILNVSDTLLLTSKADINILLCRHDQTKINEVKQSLSIFSQIGQQPECIVYNSYQKPSSYYGYYGIYADYNYQYYAQKYLYNEYKYEKED